jgi:hypothetical protein
MCMQIIATFIKKRRKRTHLCSRARARARLLSRRFAKKIDHLIDRNAGAYGQSSLNRLSC